MYPNEKEVEEEEDNIDEDDSLLVKGKIFEATSRQDSSNLHDTWAR